MFERHLKWVSKNCLKISKLIISTKNRLKQPQFHFRLVPQLPKLSKWKEWTSIWMIRVVVNYDSLLQIENSVFLVITSFDSLCNLTIKPLFESLVGSAYYKIGVRMCYRSLISSALQLDSRFSDSDQIFGNSAEFYLNKFSVRTPSLCIKNLN